MNYFVWSGIVKVDSIGRYYFQMDLDFVRELVALTPLNTLSRGLHDFSYLPPKLDYLYLVNVGACMDNYKRGLHSHLGAGAKTSLGVCLSELKH